MTILHERMHQIERLRNDFFGEPRPEDGLPDSAHSLDDARAEECSDRCHELIIWFGGAERSIRNTTVEAYVEPLVHEIKVQRADLLSAPKKPEKRAGYLALASGCYYVLAKGIGPADDVPLECCVIIATPTQLVVARHAPRHTMSLALHHWMALTKAQRVHSDEALESQL